MLFYFFKYIETNIIRVIFNIFALKNTLYILNTCAKIDIKIFQAF